jgi:hypothetical protein
MALVYYGSPVVLGDFEIISIEAVKRLRFWGDGSGGHGRNDQQAIVHQGQ